MSPYLVRLRALPANCGAVISGPASRPPNVYEVRTADGSLRTRARSDRPARCAIQGGIMQSKLTEALAAEIALAIPATTAASPSASARTSGGESVKGITVASWVVR